MSKLNHRPDIDGLRALAVISVILYHAGIWWVPGGFVGVDIFFVISGYLISSIILSEISRGEFSFKRFFERRLRRIIPALLVMLAIVVATAQIIALPEQAQDTAKSGLAALFSVSNFWFWQRSGYFAPATEFMPLLHTWSLGVEEQFYLVFPVMLLVLARIPFQMKWLLFGGTIAFFLLGLWFSNNKPSVAYYLLPARAWEFGVGTLLAANIVPPLQRRLLIEVISALGFILIIFAVIFISSDMIFPGWAALLPVLGAAMTIHAGGSAWISRNLLSARPVVYIGLLSYSLYLWHWPWLTAMRIRSGSIFLDLPLASLAVAATFVTAWLSWRFVEQPFRDGQFAPMNKLIFSINAAGILIVCIAVLSILNAGFPGRLNERGLAAIGVAGQVDPLQEPCRGVHDTKECRFGSANAPISYAIIGDSHAPSFRHAIRSSEIMGDAVGTLYWMEGCPLLLDVSFSHGSRHEECGSFIDDIWAAISSQPDLNTIILVGRWPAWTTGLTPEHRFLRRQTLLIDSQTVQPSIAENVDVFERSLGRTLERLNNMGFDVILAGAAPEPVFDVPTATAMATIAGRELPRGIPRSDVESRAGAVDTLLRTITARHDNVELLSYWEAFCDDFWCDTAREGLPLFKDDDHLSIAGAVLIVGPAIALPQ
ncbi:acyltransferase [Flavimaricola sp.]|nr:acyltransferase family protein [Flavimaricola sp.]MDA9020158.1 acyltransferase [Flavimaricola sp.]